MCIQVLYVYARCIVRYLVLFLFTVCDVKNLPFFRNHQMASAGAQSLSLSSNVPLLNYQPGLYQQATINIPGLAQQSVPLQARPTQLCAQSEPFQQTLIVCPPTIQGELVPLLPQHHPYLYTLPSFTYTLLSFLDCNHDVQDRILYIKIE